ncbi:hypothetical protein BC940DRAFT_309233 [Gongronella butleri]|nr:hypothetical protein BC940DRAFT_309233 [Gongronella butleri]
MGMIMIPLVQTAQKRRKRYLRVFFFFWLMMPRNALNRGPRTCETQLSAAVGPLESIILERVPRKKRMQRMSCRCN